MDAQFPAALEEFVDLEKYLAMESEATPSILSEAHGLVNGVSKGFDLDGGDTIDIGKPHGAYCSIPEDIWTLLNEIENTGDSDVTDTHTVPTSVTDVEAQLLKSDDELRANVILYSGKTPNSSELMAAGDCVSDEKKVNASLSIGHASVASCANTFETGLAVPKTDQVGDNVMGLPTPLINFDFPLDVDTPDIDIGMLTSGTFELSSATSTTVNLPLFESKNNPGLEDHILKLQDEFPVSTDVSQAPLLPNSPPHETAAVGNLLTLTIGNSRPDVEPPKMGNGAKLQLKRKAIQAEKIVQIQQPGLTNCITNQVDSVLEIQQPVLSDGVTNQRHAMIIIKFIDANAIVNQETVSTAVHAESDRTNSNFSDQSNDCTSPPAKVCVIDENIKHAEMRRKNNEASRRSRQTRKTRERDMEKLAKKLELENKQLQVKVDHLTKLRDSVKAELMKVLHGKK